ncbi:MAG: hypothetical protein CM15mP103_04300 [Gammaproteobacteria bacterium]|nr:MAG: hypothetical protein CM15mP103_04300 [Gammaproteobacteria bacterium]
MRRESGLLATLDWWVIGTYLFLLLALGGFLSRRQQSGADYFVAGRSERPFSIALSVLATQCSTNSILGAPAFVAFAAGGGLVWLQYELAVPLAMIFTMIFVIPMFQRLQLVSVYEYLERRFDLKTRLLLSGVFQVLRLLAAAVTIYGVSAMIDLITGIGFLASLLIFGVFTVLYDVLGGHPSGDLERRTANGDSGECAGIPALAAHERCRWPQRHVEQCRGRQAGGT